MPLQHLYYPNPHTLIGIWRLNESEDFFLPHKKWLVHDPANLSSISHPQRRTEWLAGRYLVWQLCLRMNLPFDGIYSDSHNKPHLKAGNGHISISHASPYVVAMVNTRGPAGIDIELIRPKLQNLAGKFLTMQEQRLAGSDLVRLAVFWGAKEALYKLYGRKCLVFKENLRLQDFDFDGQSGILTGIIVRAGEERDYRLPCYRFGNHVLVFTV